MAKGSKEDPYTMEEYKKMIEEGTWKSAFVIDDEGRISYALAEVKFHGYSSMGSGSNNGSQGSSDYKEEDEEDDDEEDDDDENSNTGHPSTGGPSGTGGPSTGGPGTGGPGNAGGNTGGSSTGGNTGNSGSSTSSIPDLSSKVTFYGYENPTGCFDQCIKMLSSVGLTVDSKEIAFMECDTNGRATEPTANVQEGIKYINSELRLGHPVIAIVDRKKGCSLGPSWTDKAGDHFVLIVGGNEKAGYHYFDPGTAVPSKGKSKENVFTFSNGTFTSDSPNNVSGNMYTLTSIRKNK